MNDIPNMSLYTTSPYPAAAAAADVTAGDDSWREPVPPSSCRREPTPPSSRIEPTPPSSRREPVTVPVGRSDPLPSQHSRGAPSLPRNEENIIPPPPYEYNINDLNSIQNNSRSSVTAAAPQSTLTLPSLPQAQVDISLIPYLTAYIDLVNKINHLKHVETELPQQVEIMKALIASVNKETWRLKVLQDKQAKEAKDVERIRNKFSIMSIKAKMNGTRDQAKEKELVELEVATAAVEAQKADLYETKRLLEKTEEEHDRLSIAVIELRDSRLALIELLNTAFESSFATNPNDHSLLQTLHRHNPILVELDTDVKAYKAATDLIISASHHLQKTLTKFGYFTNPFDPQFQNVEFFENKSAESWKSLKEEAKGELRGASDLIKKATVLVPKIAEKLGKSNIGDSVNFVSSFSEIFFNKAPKNWEDSFSATNKLNHITQEVLRTNSWLKDETERLLATRSETVTHMTNIRRVLTAYRMDCFEETMMAQGMEGYEGVRDIEGWLPDGGVVGQMAVGGLVVLRG